MARQLQETRIQKPTSREKLKPAGKPYYREIDNGIHLGYRKAKNGGKWTLRVYLGNARYKTETIGVADDNIGADGHRVLNYGQAKIKAEKRARELTAAADGRHIGPYTVRQAFEDYIAHQRRRGRNTGEAERRITHIADALGDIEVSRLKKKQITDWMDEMASTPPRLRNGQFKDVDMEDPEVIRRRRDTTNRHLADLKAALNLAYKENKVSSARAWSEVEAFEDVSAARVRYLSMQEVTRLLNAAPPDLRALINAGLLTGARLSDLLRMKVGDYLQDTGSVMIENSKVKYKGKPRFACALTDEGKQFFNAHTAGREPGQIMFTRDDGRPWARSDVGRPMREASEAARLDPPASFHVLRHTYASHAVMNGTPLMVVAQNLGHADTRMCEKHYGHLAPSYVQEAIAKGVPTWGVQIDETVTPMRAGK